MRKRDLVFAGLLLAAISPVSAQTVPTGPTRTDKDAKVIFVQDFEADWETWSNQVVDQITELQYYNTDATGSQSSKKIWPGGADHETFNWDNVVIRTDSVFDLKNGVKTTGKAEEMEMYSKDRYTILEETSVERMNAMAQFGEDGGRYVFQYVADSVKVNGNSYTPNYRRNLFVRGLPIEDESSYRLTLYVKASPTNAHAGVAYEPRLYADVMRGYFNSEKPFSMGLENDADHYKYNSTFEYQKTDFSEDNEWEKVVFMTYYLNDSIANAFVFVNGYWWDDNWIWAAGREGNTSGHDLRYIVQPDKFFVRISFSSSDTDFQIDNLSLTKSWIGGCEYDKDKMRIDFGYDTNLKELAQAAFAENRIAQKEVVAEVDPAKVDSLGYEYYFEVWGQKKDGTWEDVPIRSAEYHDDGYMYMFTDFYKVGEEWYPFLFDDYDSVLVTFHNPADQPELCLKYNGSKFPMALDTTWIKNGKIVPDFYNEIAQANPNVFDGVHSLKDLPPVMQVAPYEEGAFGLESTRELRFKFSREVVLVNNTDPTKKAVAYVGNETWNLSWDDENSQLVLTRPSQYTGNLKGDYEVQINQIYGIGTEKGDNVVCHYHFGDFARVPSVFEKTTDWKSEVTGTSRPYPTSVYVHSGADPFKKGDGQNSPGKCGLYNMNGEGQYNAAFYLSSRTSGETGNMYSIETLAAGDYTITFRALGWSSSSKKLVLYIYPKPEQELIDGDANGFAILKAVAEKVEIGRITKWDANTSSAGDWKEGFTDVNWSFNVPSDGDYVLEFYTDGSTDYKGVLFSNYSIMSKGALPEAPCVALNKSVDAANAQVALADADIAHYGGDAYNALKAKITYYNYNPQGEFTSTKPSEWAAAKKDLDDATAALKTRMADVKTFTDEIDKVTAKLTDTETKYSGLALWKSLKETETAALAVVCPRKTSDDLKALVDQYEKEIAALDARIAAVDEFDAQLARAATLIEAKEKAEWDEYPAMVSAYNNNKDFDKIAEADDALATASATVKGANDAYEFKLFALEPLTRRVKALHKLAETLGSDIVSNEALEAIFAANEIDDDNLAEVYKSAIKIALYEKLAEDPISQDSLDLSPFIKNYYLYQTVKYVDRSDKNMPDNQTAGADPDGGNIQYTQHKYNSGSLNGKLPIWVMITEVDYDDLYPGWTVRAFNTGNAMITGEKGYTSYQKGLPIFDAEIGMDWNSRAEMYTKLVDLPVGTYALAVELKEFTPSESDGKIATLDVTLPDSVYSAKATEKGAQTLKVDSIVVAEGDTASIKFMLRSQNGWSRADDFSLMFLETDNDFNYAAAAVGEKSNLAKLISVVDLAPAKAAKVEYYNLDGVKMAAPKAGGISIRVTTMPNGKRVVEKILVK